MYRLEQCFALERYRDDRHIGHRELRGRNPGRPTILVQQRKFHGYNFQRVRAINTNLELNCVPDRWQPPLRCGASQHMNARHKT